MSHWNVFSNHSNKIETLVNDINSMWNFLVGDVLSENGITKAWRDRVINNIVERLCDLTYDLNNLRKMLSNVKKSLAKAYSEADNFNYSDAIRSYYNYLDFTCYWRINNPNYLFIIPDRVRLFSEKLTRFSNSLSQHSSNLYSYGETVYPFISYNFAVIRKKVSEICFKAIRISNVMYECMDLYDLADTSSASDQAASKYLQSLLYYNSGIKYGNTRKIKDLYDSGIFDSYSNAKDLKEASKPLKSILSFMGEYCKNADSLKNAKATIGAITDTYDALAKMFNEDFTFEDGTSLYKSYASWIKSIIDSKAKDFTKIAGYNPENLEAYLSNINKADKWKMIGRGIGFSGDIATYIGTLYNLFNNVEGTDYGDLIDNGVDVAQSGTFFAYHGIYGAEAAKEYVKQASGYFTLAKGLGIFVWKLGDQLYQYNEDGQITVVEGAKATNTASVHSLVSIFNSVTFNIFNLDADKISNEILDFGDNMSYYAGDKLNDHNNPNFFDKFGIFVESLWVGNQSRNADEWAERIVSNNSVYYMIENIMMSDTTVTNVESLNDAVNNLNSIFPNNNMSVPSAQYMTVEDKISEWQRKMTN